VQKNCVDDFLFFLFSPSPLASLLSTVQVIELRSLCFKVRHHTTEHFRRNRCTSAAS